MIPCPPEPQRKNNLYAYIFKEKYYEKIRRKLGRN